jgi:hypothetical protein
MQIIPHLISLKITTQLQKAAELLYAQFLLHQTISRRVDPVWDINA